MIKITRTWFINVAISFDGKISELGKQVEISSKEDWEVVHKFRNEIAAIVVGANTIKVDNPSLKTKASFLPKGSKINHPIRVVLDRSGTCDPNSNVFQDQNLIPTLWVTESNKVIDGVTKIQTSDINEIMKEVNLFCDRAKRSGDIMIEGGAIVINNFIQSKKVTKMRIYRNSNIIENGVPLFTKMQNQKLHLISVRKLGPGIEEIYGLS